MELESLFQDVMDGFAICNNKVAVAVSGGIDSIVLLHLITSWAKKRQCLPPIALAVNHGLRPESQEEVEFVVSYAKELGVKKSFILNWEKAKILKVMSNQRHEKHGTSC